MCSVGLATNNTRETAGCALTTHKALHGPKEVGEASGDSELNERCSKGRPNGHGLVPATLAPRQDAEH